MLKRLQMSVEDGDRDWERRLSDKQRELDQLRATLDSQTRWERSRRTQGRGRGLGVSVPVIGALPQPSQKRGGVCADDDLWMGRRVGCNVLW